MRRVLLATALTLLASTTTFAAEPAAMTSAMSDEALMTTMPGDAVTVTDWYKQNVYDPSENKIGEIVDVLSEQEWPSVGRYHLGGRLLGNGYEGCSRTI